MVGRLISPNVFSLCVCAGLYALSCQPALMPNRSTNVQMRNAAPHLLGAVNFNQMKVKDLIKELQKQDPEKEVMIQQGEEADYMKAYTVKVKDLVDMNDIIDDGIIQAVVIEYS